MIVIQNLHKYFRPAAGEQVAAIDNVSFSVAAGDFHVLLGASGSGKTTTLRCVAGLETPDKGEITIDGQTVFSATQRIAVPPEQRPIGMVFQSYALWPHMDVTGNILFPLKYGARRVRMPEARARIERVLQMLQLEKLARRPVTKLSGGQQQRVALARAIALEPKVLLMDEPLSNLDANLRAEVREELKSITARLGITTLYVTHDQTEALALGTQIGVMNHGKILQAGPPWDVYRMPRDLFVARFLGEVNLVDVVVKSTTGNRCIVETPLGELTAMAPRSLVVGTPAVLVIRLEDLRRGTPSGRNHVKMVVKNTEFMGDAHLCRLESNDVLLQVKIPLDETVSVGAPVELELPADRCFVFSAAATAGPTSASAKAATGQGE